MVRGRRPVNDEIILDFGVPYSPGLIKRLGLKNTTHQGIDFGCAVGTPCVAYRDGFIQLAGEVEGFGQRVWLYCDVPKEEQPIRVLYAHLSRISVIEGGHIKEGDIIGLTGQSGKVSGPHLHFELRQLPEDKAIEPKFYLTRSNKA